MALLKKRNTFVVLTHLELLRIAVKLLKNFLEMANDKLVLNFKEKLLKRIKNIYAYLFGYKVFKSLNLFLVSAGFQALGINNPSGKGKASYLQGSDILIKKLVKKIDNKNNLFLLPKVVFINF